MRMPPPVTIAFGALGIVLGLVILVVDDTKSFVTYLAAGAMIVLGAVTIVGTLRWH